MFGFFILGHYCLAATPPTPCPEGTFNNGTGLAAEDECTHCSVGMYCEGQGNILPDGNCTAGQYCYRGARSPVPDDNNVDYPDNGPCPPGHYCPEGIEYPVDCPAGSWRNETAGQSEDDCAPCPGGYYCEVGGT